MQDAKHDEDTEMAMEMAEIIQNVQKENNKKLNEFMSFSKDLLKQLASVNNNGTNAGNSNAGRNNNGSNCCNTPCKQCPHCQHFHS